MNKGKHIKRLIFVMAILAGLMFLSGEGGGFLRLFIAGACFLFAWGCWENWVEVRELEQEEDEDGDKW